MFTATADLILPNTVTGSFPRPRWFDVSMWAVPENNNFVFSPSPDGTQEFQ